MFKISPTPLEDIDLRNKFTSDRAGALCSFEGVVRNHDEGKKVIALEYEAYESLCHTEAQKILDEVQQKYNVIDTRVFHRTGKCSVGEMAVWVGVIAEHRDDSFKACRYIIDEIKSRLPIWKKEYYENGNSNWVNCKQSHSNYSHTH